MKRTHGPDNSIDERVDFAICGALLRILDHDVKSEPLDKRNVAVATQSFEMEKKTLLSLLGYRTRHLQPI